MKKYKHLFFDIDRTLWDYESNAKEALKDMHRKNHLEGFEIPLSDFFNVFNVYNESLWIEYGLGTIKKEYLRDQRFVLTLAKFGVVNQELATKLSEDYIKISPDKTNLFPEVVETLEYLKTKYHLHIITNGFNEVQFRKLRNCGIEHYFKKIVTSDNARSQKPHREIFQYALSSVNARKSESLMIGDDWELDILGAKQYGLDQVYFNPQRKELKGQATFTINNMGELREIL